MVTYENYGFPVLTCHHRVGKVGGGVVVPRLNMEEVAHTAFGTYLTFRVPPNL